MKTYLFNGEQLPLCQINAKYFPSRSPHWVKKGLLEGATTVPEMVKVSETRLRQGQIKSCQAAKRSPFGKDYDLTTNRQCLQIGKRCSI